MAAVLATRGVVVACLLETLLLASRDRLSDTPMQVDALIVTI